MIFQGGTDQIYEYHFTLYAIYAAVSVGLEDEGIIRALSKLYKTSLQPQVPSFIRDCTRTEGKNKLVLKKGRYLVQTPLEFIPNHLLTDRPIASAVIHEDPKDEKYDVDETDAALIASREANDKSTLCSLNKVLGADLTTKEICSVSLIRPQGDFNFEPVQKKSNAVPMKSITR